VGLGILPAAIVALVLPLYPDLSEYALTNDTDLPAAFFLVLGLLIFIWILQGTRSRSWKWLLWGLCAGWGTAVRTSNLPVFLTLTVTLACLSHRRVGETLRHLVAAVIGSLPLMIPLLWYNHHYCGSCFRDPHAFWESYDYGDLWQFFGLRYAFGSPSLYTENLRYSGNLIFYGREILAQFSMWPYFVTYRGFLVHELTYFLSGLMVVGVVCVYRRARSNPAARQLLWYAVVGGGTTLVFYVITKVGSIRYLVPIIPFAAIFTATAVVDVARWLGRRPLLRVLIPVFLLMSAVTPYRWWKTGGVQKIGEWIPKAQVLEGVNSQIESNAVVLGFDYWELVNHFVIRGTARQFVPIKNKSYFRVQPKPPAGPPKTYLAHTERNDDRQLETGAVDIFDFSATEDPMRIQELLVHGLPVYVIDFPLVIPNTVALESIYGNNEVIRALEKNFKLLPWGHYKAERTPMKVLPGATCVILWKVKPQIPLPLVQ